MLFLTPTEHGGAHSTVLSIQKVAEIDELTDIHSAIDSISAHIYRKLVDSGYKDIAPHSISAINESERRCAEDRIAQAIISKIITDQESVYALPTGIRLPIVDSVFSSIAEVWNTSIVSTTYRSFILSLESIGISPRAPTVFA